MTTPRSRLALSTAPPCSRGASPRAVWGGRSASPPSSRSRAYPRPGSDELPAGTSPAGGAGRGGRAGAADRGAGQHRHRRPLRVARHAVDVHPRLPLTRAGAVRRTTLVASLVANPTRGGRWPRRCPHELRRRPRTEGPDGEGRPERAALRRLLRRGGRPARRPDDDRRALAARGGPPPAAQPRAPRPRGGIPVPLGAPPGRQLT